MKLLSLLNTCNKEELSLLHQSLKHSFAKYESVEPKPTFKSWDDYGVYIIGNIGDYLHVNCERDIALGTTRLAGQLLEELVKYTQYNNSTNAEIYRKVDAGNLPLCYGINVFEEELLYDFDGFIARLSDSLIKTEERLIAEEGDIKYVFQQYHVAYKLWRDIYTKKLSAALEKNRYNHNVKGLYVYAVNIDITSQLLTKVQKLDSNLQELLDKNAS